MLKINRPPHPKSSRIAARWHRFGQKNSSAQLACVCGSVGHLAALFLNEGGKIYYVLYIKDLILKVEKNHYRN